MATIPTVHIAQHRANLTNTGSQTVPAVVDIGSGRYIVVWTEGDGGPIATTAGSDLVGQIFDHAGNRIGGEYQINTSHFADNEGDAALAPRLGGGFVMVYEDTNASGTSIRVDFRDANGNHIDGSTTTVQTDTNTDVLSNPSVAMRPDGSYLVAYQLRTVGGSDQIFGHVIGANGTVGAQFFIADGTSIGAGDVPLVDVDVAVLSNGSDVIVCDANTTNRVSYKIGTGSGSPDGPIDNGANSQGDVRVAALAGGGFVAAWTEVNGDGSSFGIRARVLNSVGAPVANSFTVNLSTSGTQADPDVVALRDGGFVVVWNDLPRGQLQGRRFDALGNAVGGEFTAGSLGAETEATIDALSDGRFVVTFRNGAGDDDIFATVFDPYGPRNSDFNKDVRGDILWRNDNGTVATWHMDTAQILSMQAFANAPNDWHLIDTGDFNGDAMSDLLWRNNDGTVGTWHMNGATVLSTQAFANAPNDWHIQGAADFNGDGKTDLLWRHDSGLVGTWHMNGATVTSTQAFANAPLDWHIQGTGDFNGDGFDDILWRNDNGAIGTWHMNGATQLSTQAFASQPADWKVQQTGDFNGDGRDDILWRQDSGTVGIWLMNGAQIIGGPTFAIGNDWHIEGTADSNGDGKDDIIWRNDNGTVATWEMNGGTILAQRTFPQVSADWHIAGNHYDFI